MVEFSLDDSFNQQMALGVTDMDLTGDSIRDVIPKIDDMVESGHIGHHTFRRYFTPIFQVAAFMHRLGMINEEQKNTLHKIHALTMSIVGVYLGYWALMNTYKVIASYQAVMAAAETTAHISVGDFASPAAATAATAIVAGSFGAGFVLGKHQHDVRAKADYNTYEGRKQIVRTIQSNPVR